MNVENLNLLAAHLRDPAVAPHFQLQALFWAPTLDEAAYSAPLAERLMQPAGMGGIAAHALALADPALVLTADAGIDIDADAANWLELDLYTAHQLFYPPAVLAATAAEAADAVQHLAESGEVVWDGGTRLVA